MEQVEYEIRVTEGKQEACKMQASWNSVRLWSRLVEGLESSYPKKVTIQLPNLCGSFHFHCTKDLTEFSEREKTVNQMDSTEGNLREYSESKWEGMSECTLPVL